MNRYEHWPETVSAFCRPGNTSPAKAGSLPRSKSNTMSKSFRGGKITAFNSEIYILGTSKNYVQ
jgi:hypothetical protein